MTGNVDRFDDYRQIVARFPSRCNCGQGIKKGDLIGYNFKAKKQLCAGCWSKWVGENREAELHESMCRDYYGI